MKRIICIVVETEVSPEYLRCLASDALDMSDNFQSSIESCRLVGVPKCIENTDWELLREQKTILLEMVEDSDNSEQEQTVDGIINFIDTIQDFAVDECGIEEEVVFGKPTEEQKESAAESFYFKSHPELNP